MLTTFSESRPDLTLDTSNVFHSRCQNVSQQLGSFFSELLTQKITQDGLWILLGLNHLLHAYYIQLAGFNFQESSFRFCPKQKYFSEKHEKLVASEKNLAALVIPAIVTSHKEGFSEGGEDATNFDFSH